MWKVIVDAWNGTSGADTKSNSATTSYDFEAMKKLVSNKDPSVVLIDVREPTEFEDVKIPGSYNVPFRSHPQGFSLDDATFERTFGFPKPSKEKELVFFCASGRRGASAQSLAEKSGYFNTSLYPGSVNDWVSKGGDKLHL